MEPLNESEVPSNNNATLPVADAPKKEDKIEDFDAEETLVFVLTDAEILKIAKTASSLTSQKRTKENELKNKTDDLKSEIKGIDADIKFNLKLIEVGKEGRNVECIKRINYTRGIVQFIYGGQVMKERSIEHNEKVRPQDNTTSSVNQ
jgi:hypothetical protein